MFYSGLLSVSFRSKTVEQIAKEAKESGLHYMEWGSDVHVPIRDEEALRRVLSAQEEYGLTCCSYGTYFYLGEDPVEDIPAYIHVAKALGTNILRLWAGKKNCECYTPEEKEEFFHTCRQAAKIAEENGAILCMECHPNTFTNTKEGALELMAQVDSPAFRMYWQPSTSDSVEYNLAYLRVIKDKIVHIHVFHWVDGHPVPLEEGKDAWLTYMKEFEDDRYFLLDFMPDSTPGRLGIQAKSLQGFIESF